MFSGRSAASLLLAVLLITGIDGKVTVEVKERRGQLILECTSDDKSKTWWGPHAEGPDMNLGALTNDPRGIYNCLDKQHEDVNDTIQVHVRMCENCIAMDPGTISGILVADVIITLLICVAVYCMSGSERGRASRASDKQVLIPNDQLYQPLRNREGSTYSHIAETRPRRK